MKQHIQKYKEEIWNKSFIVSVSGSVILLLTSLVINYYAGSFATNNMSNSVTDIILDNVKYRDVDGIFVYGILIFWFFVAYLLAMKPKQIPFIFKSIALFVFIRSISITLTHIAPFAGQINLPPDNLIRLFTFGGDLFFSAHTGLPFLMALLYWNDKLLRYIFLTTSLLFAVVVLLGHYHYSIDVFAAFFITYTIAHLSRLFFDKDHETFISRV